MKKAELESKIARLETICDHLLTEVGYVDNLMRLVGFAGGLETVKATAKELYEIERKEQKNDNISEDE